MAGLGVAFKKFSYAEGILNSPWCGFDNFKFLFSNKDLSDITFNTVYLNLLFIVFGTATSVFLALLFVEIKNKAFKRISQSIVIIPYFISWAVIAMFLQGFLGDRGLVNQFVQNIGLDKIQFYNDPAYWRVILVILRIWQGAGFGTIIYIATITGFDTEIYEAARIDGANRFQLISRLTLPMLKTTIVMLTLMSIGNIFKGDFGMIYALIGDNSLIYSKTDVIDTYVYRALRVNSNLGFSTAVSFYQSTIGFVIVLLSNWITRRVDPDSAIF
jgi:putative aldouronate transport system permease protein